jgi:hypothetical protein
MSSMLRTSAIVLVAVVTALFVEDKLHGSSKDKENELAQRLEELEQAQRQSGELSRHSASETARQRAQEAGNRRVALAPKPVARHEEKDEAADSAEEAEEAPSARAEVEPARTDGEMRSAIEGVFAADPVDPSWSVEARRRAQQGLERALPEGSAALSVRCGGSMCRIETRHHGMDEYHHFVEQAFLNPGTALWNGGMFSSVTERSDSGEVTVVSFLARDGQPLPVVSRM